MPRIEYTGTSSGETYYISPPTQYNKQTFVSPPAKKPPVQITTTTTSKPVPPAKKPPTVTSTPPMIFGLPVMDFWIIVGLSAAAIIGLIIFMTVKK